MQLFPRIKSSKAWTLCRILFQSLEMFHQFNQKLFLCLSDPQTLVQNYCSQQGGSIQKVSVKIQVS